MITLDDVSKTDFKPTHEQVEFIPYGYEKNEKGIFKKTWRENKKEGTSEMILVPLSYTPFEITTKMENPDTHEVFYEISFDRKKIIVSGSDISNKKGMVKLAGYGVNTTESNAKDLCKYIMELKYLNQIPESLIYDRFGWKKDGSFVLGKTKITKTNDSIVSLTTSSNQTEAVHQKGTVTGWVNAISKLMSHDAQRFKMYLGTAAPLLNLIDESNICLNDFADTSVGKTITTLCSMSMYGAPDDLLFSGDTTKVGMERMVTLFCDMPINIDDAQNIEKKQLNDIVYMLVNGVGKLRGAKEGGTQEVLSWRTVGLFTSEVPLLTEESKGGLGARLIEVSKGLGAHDDKAVSLFEKEIKYHHGMFAPMLIKYILHNESEIHLIHKNSKKRMEKERANYVFNNTISGIAGRLANTYATILTAARVFENLYQSIGGEYKDPEPIVIKIFRHNVKKQGAETYMMRGLYHILSWIAANRTNFLENGSREYDHEGNTKRYKIYGDITPTYYYLIPSELKTELDRSKFSIERLIEDFKEAGYLDMDKDKQRNQKTRRLEGTPTKTFSLIRERVDITDVDSEKVKK